MPFLNRQQGTGIRSLRSQVGLNHLYWGLRLTTVTERHPAFAIGDDFFALKDVRALLSSEGVGTSITLRRFQVEIPKSLNIKTNRAFECLELYRQAKSCRL